MEKKTIFIISPSDVGRFYLSGGHRRARSQSFTKGAALHIGVYKTYSYRKLKFGVRYSRTALVLATPVASKLTDL